MYNVYSLLNLADNARKFGNFNTVMLSHLKTLEVMKRLFVIVWTNANSLKSSLCVEYQLHPVELTCHSLNDPNLGLDGFEYHEVQGQKFIVKTGSGDKCIICSMIIPIL